MTLPARFSNLEILEVGQEHTNCPLCHPNSSLHFTYVLYQGRARRQMSAIIRPVAFLYHDRHLLSLSSFLQFPACVFYVFLIIVQLTQLYAAISFALCLI